jgi:hypothetical protein
MSESSPPNGQHGPSQGGGDPWAAFGYLVAGVAVYGALGWGLATWLHASYLLPIGIVVGAVLGLVMVMYQTGLFSGGIPGSTTPSGEQARPPDGAPSPPAAGDGIPSWPQPHDPVRQVPPPGESTDDRGDSE